MYEDRCSSSLIKKVLLSFIQPKSTIDAFKVMQRKNEVRVFAFRFQTRTNLSHAMFLNLAILTGMEDTNICRISFIDLDIYIN